MNDDQSRQGATSPDTDFTLSIDDALERYARAARRVRVGLPFVVTGGTSSSVAGETLNAMAACHTVTTVGLRLPISRLLTYPWSTPIRAANSSCDRPAATR